MRRLLVLAAVVAVPLLVAWLLRPVQPGRPVPVPTPPPAVSAIAAAPASSAARAVPRAASPVASGAAPQTAAWGDAPDLWAFAQQAAQSPNPALRLEALYAARECAGLLTQRDGYLEALWGQPNAGARQVALQDLQARCHGFATVGKQASLDVLRQLNQPSPLADDLNRAMQGQADAQTLRRLIRSGSPLALEHGLLHAADHGAGRLGLGGANKRAYRTAAWYAACELGKPCGPQSWQAQLHCVMVGACGGPLGGDPATEAPAQVEAWRRQIVHAVRTDDWATLGLN